MKPLLTYLHRFALKIWSRAELKYLSLYAALLGERLHQAVTGAPIRSLSELKQAIQNKRRKWKRYSYLSFPYGKSFANGKKTLQTHLHVSVGFIRLRLSYFDFFNRAIDRLIRINIPKKKLTVKEPVFALSYYNTHFGHCTGEILGSILFYADLISDGSPRKLLMPKLGKDTDRIVSLFANDKVLRIEPELFLEFELVFLDIVILPLMHPHQNLNYLHQKLSTAYPYMELVSQRVFVTSLRPERIANIENLVAALRTKNFCILSSVDFGALENSIIKNADMLLIEDGSLSHLALMHRTNKYFVLSPARHYDYTPAEFFGGYVFNEFHSYLREEIPCEIVHTDKHIMSSKLVVDIDAVLTIVDAKQSSAQLLMR